MRPVAAGKFDNQYFAGSAAPLGHSIRSHSSGWRRAPPVVPVRGSDTDRRKPRTEVSFCPRARQLLPHAVSGKADGQLSGADRLMIFIAPQQFRRPPHLLPRLGRQRRAGPVPRRSPKTERPRICQVAASCSRRGTDCPCHRLRLPEPLREEYPAPPHGDLIERYSRLGLELNLLGNACLAPSRVIAGPTLRAGRAGRPSAHLKVPVLTTGLTATRQACPVFLQPDRCSIGAPPLRTLCPSWENRCRRQSRQPRVPAAVPPKGTYLSHPLQHLFIAPRARRQPDDVKTSAFAARFPAPTVPPSAPRSCALQGARVPCNSSSKVRNDPCDRQPEPTDQDMPPVRFCCALSFNGVYPKHFKSIMFYNTVVLAGAIAGSVSLNPAPADITLVSNPSVPIEDVDLLETAAELTQEESWSRGNEVAEQARLASLLSQWFVN